MEVRDLKGNYVCTVDKDNMSVEIIQNGFRTIVQFLNDGHSSVIVMDNEGYNRER